MKRLAALAAIAFTLATYISSAGAQQPYAGFEARPIKALSDQQVADLKAGRGMGLALAAELNGFPGPVHVLEFADSLALSDVQRAKMQELFAAMKAETVPLGEKLIALEADLERQFAGKTITEVSLAAVMQAIGSAQAALRTAHLKYHLATAEALTSTQTQRYAELRGYSGVPQTAHQHGGHQR
jgi:Spy/CpxP family protein refolding chaperone